MIYLTACFLMILVGFFLDLLLADPLWMPHPVRLMGLLIGKGEVFLRRLFPGKELFAGTLLVIVIAALSFLLPLLLLLLALRISFLAWFVLGAFMSYQVISPRGLQIEAMKVYRKAAVGDLAGARKAVSGIVGRDTETLSMEGVIKATVETVAENLSDGVIAPLFFLALGGPSLGMLYKAINTMDSMIGYKDSRYIDFGRCAAKLDDAANWLPARISARLIIISSVLLGLDGKNAARIYRRDKDKHASPNSGHPEAACAGALRVALAGSTYYGGTLEEKPIIGDGEHPVSPEDIRIVCRLMYVPTILFLFPVCLISGVRGFVFSLLIGGFQCI
ncbi:adenosylcobinamide-phosphate synthase CbiB [Treponema primitia]|uniref:adenosylcobinamide-phosphate synthase CbiB n=1 Tax=Treponema primitia TaxID=88058 RepID=UPI0002554C34|nr:adenosylcobinamide-phosphate synthase CbiB [Treponema primitia]